MKKVGVALIILVLMIMLCTIDGQAQDRWQDIEYDDDQDGHREPWVQWVENECTGIPWKIIDCKECNPATGKRVIVWLCLTGKKIPDHTAAYTAHIYCPPPIIGDPAIFSFYYLPLVNRR